jgi:hypothetical protein
VPHGLLDVLNLPLGLAEFGLQRAPRRRASGVGPLEGVAHLPRQVCDILGRKNLFLNRPQQTHQEEFYDLVAVPDPLAEHNALLQEWERTYNTIRPHQALGYRTPQEYLTQWQTQHHDQ